MTAPDGCLETRCERLEADLETARETNRRLNRRVQLAERAATEKIATHPNRSLGRGLANYAAHLYARERDEALAEIARLRAALEEIARYPAPHCDGGTYTFGPQAVAKAALEGSKDELGKR